MLNPLPNQPDIIASSQVTFNSLEVEGAIHIPLNAKKWTSVNIGGVLYLIEKPMEEPKRHPGTGSGMGPKKFDDDVFEEGF